MSTIRRQLHFEEAANHYEIVLEMLQQDPDGVALDFVQYITELRDQALDQVKP